MGGAAAALLRAVALVQSPAAARKLYTSLRHLPSPGGEFWHAALDLELESAGAGRADALPRPHIVALFEVGPAAWALGGHIALVFHHAVVEGAGD